MNNFRTFKNKTHAAKGWWVSRKHEEAAHCSPLQQSQDSLWQGYPSSARNLEQSSARNCEQSYLSCARNREQSYLFSARNHEQEY